MCCLYTSLIATLMATRPMPHVAAAHWAAIVVVAVAAAGIIVLTPDY